MKQLIECPNCKAIELAEVKNTKPFPTYIHNCSNCFYTIMESEWCTVPALSVKQPWGALIIEGIKPIENRTWKLPEKHKGKQVLVHVSKSAEYDCCKSSPFAPLFVLGEKKLKALSTEQRKQIIESSKIRGSIIGSARIIDCVKNHENIWADKSGKKPIYNWVLSNPEKFTTPIPCNGQQRFFIPNID